MFVMHMVTASKTRVPIAEDALDLQRVWLQQKRREAEEIVREVVQRK